MRIECKWEKGMLFTASNKQFSVGMDAKKPFGTDSQMSPKELVVAGLCGCTAMDVVGLLAKHKQTMESFTISANVEMTSTGHPHVFSKIDLEFKFKGSIDREILLESIRLSQTKYCGVSAMMSKAVDIHYSVNLNNELIGSGKAAF